MNVTKFDDNSSAFAGRQTGHDRLHSGGVVGVNEGANVLPNEISGREPQNSLTSRTDETFRALGFQNKQHIVEILNH